MARESSENLEGKEVLGVIGKDKTILSQWSGTKEGWFIGNAHRTDIDTTDVLPTSFRRRGEDHFSVKAWCCV